MRERTTPTTNQPVKNDREIVIKAKRKLKFHLDRYAHEDEFVVTERKAKYWFSVINKAMFDNKLPKPIKWDLKNLRGCWGRCSGGEGAEVTIGISTQIDSRGLFLATLAHEMVHAWELDSKGEMSHGKVYLKWKRLFKKKFNIIL